MDHPPLIGYWTDLVRFMVTLISQLIIPTETIGSSRRQASLTPSTRGGGHQATKTTDWLASRMPGARNSFPPTFDHFRNANIVIHHPRTVLAKFAPRAHHYAFKIPWASTEAQYGQSCKHSRNVFYLFSLLFLLSLKTSDHHDSIYIGLYRSSDPYARLRGYFC